MARRKRWLADRIRRATALHELDCGEVPHGATADRGWRTTAVLGLARYIRDRRAVSVLPVLADALEEAGCTDAALLEHCRDVAGHREGCWVVDLLLRGR
jgi:hypothetical protein